MKIRIVHLLLTGAVCAFTVLSNAQSAGVSIGPTANPPHPSAGLDVQFTDKGQLAPRLTTEQRNAIGDPAPGLFIFNTTTNCFNVFVGNGWRQWCGDCDFANPVASANGPICEGETLNLFAVSIPGATYSWTGPNGFSSSVQNPTLPNATSAASGAYSVTASLNGCTSQPQITVVSVNAIPSTPTVGTNGPLCVGDVLNLTTPSVPGASYTWTGPNSFSALTQNPSKSNIQLADAGVYTVTASVNGCSSEEGSANLVVNAIPAATFGPSGGKTGAAVVFTPTVSGASYNWVFAAGTPSTSSSSGPSVSWSSAGSYNVTLTVTENGCSATSSSSITITDPIQQQFNYSGAEQTWIVPSGISTVQIEVWGAQGGTPGGNIGGLGGYSKGDLAVTPGQTLYINVGGRPNSYVGGFNGGGDGVGSSASGGGGGTDVRVGGNTFNNRIIVAGGGGGATGSWTVTGGDGGGLVGGVGYSSNGDYRNGQGGTQSAGGAQQSGYPGSGSTDGYFGVGGRGSYNNGESSGGGGGWYGGGGGEAGAGGGGSGYIGGVTNGVMNSGVNSGHGKVIITY